MTNRLFFSCAASLILLLSSTSSAKTTTEADIWRSLNKHHLRKGKCPRWLSKTIEADFILVGCRKFRVPQPAFLVVGYTPSSNSEGTMIPNRHEGVRLTRILVDAKSRSVLSQATQASSAEEIEYRGSHSEYAMQVVDLDNDRIDEVLETLQEGSQGLYYSHHALLTIDSKHKMHEQWIPGATTMASELYEGGISGGNNPRVCGGSVAVRPATKRQGAHLQVSYEVFLPEHAAGGDCGNPLEKRLWLDGHELVKSSMPARARPKARSSKLGAYCKTSRDCGPGESCQYEAACDTCDGGTMQCELNRP